MDTLREMAGERNNLKEAITDLNGKVYQVEKAAKVRCMEKGLDDFLTVNWKRLESMDRKIARRDR